ncbi:MAG: carbamate kinase, partial [Rhodobacterales bacterium]|nr:carbamate kinase [Rhodobacterales bacterium]
RLTPQEARDLDLPAGSMGPKMAAAADFAEAGGLAGIGRLDQAVDILNQRAGTCVCSPANDLKGS